MSHIWFVSDVHLSDRRPEMVAHFFSFLKSAGQHRINALYFLGDIFEYWLGPDVRPDYFEDFVTHCAQLTTRGVALYFLPGNRDFLLTPEDVAGFYATLLPDETCITVNQQRLLLMHGDTLCPQDRGYQIYRWVSHKPWVCRAFLSWPRARREQIAQRLRAQSARHPKPMVLEKTKPRSHLVCQRLQAHDAQICIQGHVHYPAHHLYQTPHGVMRHMIMSDWRRREGNYIALRDTRLSYHTF